MQVNIENTNGSVRKVLIFLVLGLHLHYISFEHGKCKQAKNHLFGHPPTGKLLQMHMCSQLTLCLYFASVAPAFHLHYRRMRKQDFRCQGDWWIDSVANCIIL